MKFKQLRWIVPVLATAAMLMGTPKADAHPALLTSFLLDQAPKPTIRVLSYKKSSLFQRKPKTFSQKVKKLNPVPFFKKMFKPKRKFQSHNIPSVLHPMNPSDNLTTGELSLSH